MIVLEKRPVVTIAISFAVCIAWFYVFCYRFSESFTPNDSNSRSCVTARLHGRIKASDTKRPRGIIVGPSYAVVMATSLVKKPKFRRYVNMTANGSNYADHARLIGRYPDIPAIYLFSIRELYPEGANPIFGQCFSPIYPAWITKLYILEKWGATPWLWDIEPLRLLPPEGLDEILREAARGKISANVDKLWYDIYRGSFIGSRELRRLDQIRELNPNTIFVFAPMLKLNKVDPIDDFSEQINRVIDVTEEIRQHLAHGQFKFIDATDFSKNEDFYDLFHTKWKYYGKVSKYIEEHS